MRSPAAWPAERPDHSEGRRRYLIAAGTAQYRGLPEAPRLWSVPGDLDRLAELFCRRLGYERVLPELAEDPESGTLRGKLSTWLHDDTRRDDDVVVIYYSGHGDSANNIHYLLATDTVEGNLAGTALATEELGRMLGETSKVRHLLVILDTCYAGQGALDLAAVARQVTASRTVSQAIGSGLWCLAATRPREEAEQGVFVDALVEAVEQLRSGSQAPYIGLEGLVDAVNQTLQRRGLRQRSTLSVTDSTGLPPFVPNPHYDPSLPAGLDLETQWRVRQQDLVVHWGPKARGVEIDTQPGWYFAGRTQVMEELIGWLTDPAADRAPRVITGGPGSGKSAVLARLVTLSDPATRRTALPATAAASPNTIPPAGLVNVAVHAKNKTLTDVLAALTAATGIRAATPTELADVLATRPGRLVVVVDALDEAVAPAELADQLLNPICAAAEVSSDLRLLIGTRRNLLDRLDPHAVVLDLDTAPWLGPDDLANYVTQVLLAEGEKSVRTPYRSQHHLARTVARAVAARAHPTFLIARIVARSLLAAGHTVDVTDPGWQQRFPDSVGQAFDIDLARYGLDGRRVRDLLIPLAWAEGAGLPWEHLWAPIARALSGNPAYTDDDIRWLREVAGGYVQENSEHGRSAYRLYHQAIAEHLRGDGHAAQIQQRISDTLTRQAPEESNGRPDWFAAHPYIRTHLATHAAAAGHLERLLEDARFLLAADPDRLLRASTTARSARAIQAAETFQAAVHQLRARPPSVAAAYLELVARQYGNDELAEEIDRLGLARPWSVRWARWRPGSPHRIVGRHDDWVRAVVVGQLNGRTVAVSAGDDRALRVWDLFQGTPVGEPLTGHDGWVWSVALSELAGRPIAVSGGGDGTVRVWDLARGAPVGQPLTGHEYSVQAVAVGDAEGGPVAISGGSDGAVRVWDLSRGSRVGQSLQRNPWLRLAAALRIRARTHADFVSSVAMSELAGRPIGVSAGRDGVVLVWNLAQPALLCQPIQPKPNSWIQLLTALGVPARRRTSAGPTVAVGELAGYQVVVSGEDDGTIQAWDLTKGTPIGKPLTGHNGAVNAMTLGLLEHNQVALSGGDDGTVRVWDLTRGSPIGEPLTGHDGKVLSVALVELEGRPVAVSAGSDGTVRAWDLARVAPVDERRTGRGNRVRTLAMDEPVQQPTAIPRADDGRMQMSSPTRGTAVGEPLTGYDASVQGVAVAAVEDRVVVISGGEDGTVRVWDFARGTPIGEPLTGHRGSVTAVAAGIVEGRPLATFPVVISGGEDGTVRVWDLARGVQVGAPLTGHVGPVTAVATGVVEDRPVAVSSGADGMVRLWNLSLGLPDGLPLQRNAWRRFVGRHVFQTESHIDYVNAVAVGTLDGRPVAASAGDDGAVLVWDLSQRTLMRKTLERSFWLRLLGAIGIPWASVTGSVDAVALGTLEGRKVVISGGDNGILRIWDLARGTEVGTPLVGHRGSVYTIEAGELVGRPVVVSGGRDGTVRLWDLIGRAHQIIEPASQVTAVAFGPDNTLVVATRRGLMMLEAEKTPYVEPRWLRP